MNVNQEDPYDYCQQLANSHYENFPVASKLLPTHLRPHVAAVYCFARIADDIADEGDLTDEERRQGLSLMRDQVSDTAMVFDGDNYWWLALHQTIKDFSIPIKYFHDLLEAFSQDISVKRYATFNELLAYCSHSASPIGRIMLKLDRCDSEETNYYSDQICSALQLINFYQDLAQDYDEMNRIYVPQDELAQFHIGEHYFSDKITDKNMRELMNMQYTRAASMINEGRPLLRAISKSLRPQIKATVTAADIILKKLQTQTDIYSRPRLKKTDWAKILFRAFL